MFYRQHPQTVNAYTSRGHKPRETAMSAAFLAALIEWARRGSPTGPIAIPVGVVDSAELVRVVTNIKCGRIGSRPSQKRRHA